MNTTDKYMRRAIAQAYIGLEEEGIPIGSVLVKDGVVIGKGRNQRKQKANPILHAEIDCLQNAGRIRNYEGTVLYSTLMPCYLCAGAIVQFGIRKVVVGESSTFAGASQFMKEHGVVVDDLDLDECKLLMRDFIDEFPEDWNEDIGIA